VICASRYEKSKDIKGNPTNKAKRSNVNVKEVEGIESFSLETEFKLNLNSIAEKKWVLFL
jgi:hypothetical protein